jgi:hypothetical protein
MNFSRGASVGLPHTRFVDASLLMNLKQHFERSDQ